jgi:death-on-curing protein
VSREPTWLSPALASAIHGQLVGAHGGGSRAPDAARLEAALARPRQRHADAGADDRPDVFRLAAAHAFGIARDRPLPEGNERLALTLAGVFLELNGWQLAATEADATSVTRALAAGELDEGGYALWLEEACVPRHAAPPRPPPRRR